MSEQFSILLGNHSRLEAGQTDGAWLPMPATTEQLHDAMRNIGVTAENPQDLFVGGFANTEQCPFDVPLSVIQSGSIDELNYLGKLLEMQGDEDKAKFAAAVTLGEYAGNLKDLINLAQNLDCYWIYPTVQSEEDYGYYLIDELDELELPEEAKRYFMYEEYGRDAAINDGGRFTEQGYIYNNKNTFSEWYNGRESDIPKEYRIMSYPQPERGETERTDFDAAATMPPAAEPRPVIPLILTADNPADKMKEITDRLEQGIMGVFESERYAEYLRTMSKFHNYSLNNTLLIAMQGGNLVKGYRQWEKEFDRHVKPGEKAIKILAPAPYKVKKEREKIDPDTKMPVIGADGKPVMETQEITIPAYKVVSVFDVSQTEGKELPNLSVSELTGDVEQYRDFFAALERTSPFAIAFETLDGGAKGRCYYEENRIAIHEGMSELQNIKTAIHEISHATMHDTAPDDPTRPDRRTREVQAESVAYAVCQHYGLDTSDYSFGYVAGWSSGKELSELKGSLETIRSTAAKLIETIDGHFAEIQQEKAAVQEQEAQPITPEPQPAQEQTEQATPPETAPQEAEPPAVKYYPINEAAARRAKEMNSYSDYKPGSATAEYRSYVEEAVQLAERQKARVDPMYHEKIDSLLDTYARKLAANMNKGFEIDARVPSILIAGGSNFPVRKKEKQNAARDTNYREWQDIQGLLDKIRSTCMGGISADDPQAVQKLEKKLAGLEKAQETMKAVNAYYRKHKTLDGCPHLSAESIEKMKADMASQWHIEDKPYPTWALSNNSAEIRRVKERIKSLSQQREIGYVGWEFEGGKVEANAEANRLQILFEEKPDAATREELKSNGFRWSPKAEAWQRQLTDNAYRSADYIKAILPLSGEKPSELLRAHIRQQKSASQEAPAPEPIYKVHTNPRSDSRENLCFLQAYIPQEDGKAQIGDVLYIGTPEKCRELMAQLNAGELTQGEVKELYAKAQEAGQDKDTFSIYQLKRGDETRDLRFEPYDRLQATGHAVDRANYELIYTAPLAPDTSLEDIYTRFNIDHPADFKGHSLSVSDIVVLHRDGRDAAHYVDSIGYREVPEFFKEQGRQLTPDELETGETVKTPRGTFYVTAMSREQMEVAGYGLHHQSEDGKYLIMGNGTRAFAIPAEQPEKVNPLKHIEDTVEQNDNAFDGLINNTPQTPTAGELEQKAKAGEPISLADYAAAIKAEKERGSAKQEKPSIRAQLRAEKERAAQKKTVKTKNHELEV
ncbi:YodL domain-containing protein [Pseudoflavonifractor phocaeensis]|uniref:YodL domain-containing protein n=1 Tax=Pseudoflavonifractor phocaeensis TaxID=1870988 RepID=UPI00195657A5|nr:YodL domain-containing protein [Pseudoflavonifractor phocaeensis]MBM6925573.1 antirestriction protein ArdA [Pseudoflavonifractor phocaeensis]